MVKRKNTAAMANKINFDSLGKIKGLETLDDMEPVSCWIDTGILAMNFICSGKFIGGGLPCGKIIEIFGDAATGKSLIAMNCLKGAQMANGVPVLLDAERAVSKDFAILASKVDPATLWVTTADTLEGCFAKIYNIIRQVRETIPKEHPIVIVYDSIAASPSEREFAETVVDMESATQAEIKAAGAGSDQPGDRAKVCSKHFRNLPNILQENNACLVVINQIRSKIGGYGCFHYSTRVTLADGTQKKIGEIVNNDMVGLEVMSFNPKTKQVEPKRIVQCHDNGNLKDGEEFLQFKLHKFGGNGKTQFACTPNHMIFTYSDRKDSFGQVFHDVVKEIPAGDLDIGDKILVSQPFYLTQDQKQVVFGSVMGDGSIRRLKEGNYHLRIDHGIQQADYCHWKEEIMSPWIGSSFVDEDNYKRTGFETIPMYELSSVKFREDGVCTIPEVVLREMGPLGLAIWYLDDGGYYGHDSKNRNGSSAIYCSKFRNRERLQKMLKDRFDLDSTLNKKGISFNVENTKKLHEIICRFVPPSMSYKLHKDLRDKFDYEIEEVGESNIYYKPIEAEILDIYEKPRTRTRKKFDITIEDNSTYIVDGAIVHNSPEVTAGGGRALEYYAGLRVRLRAKKVPKDKHGNIMGANITIQNIKNRFFKPYVETENIYLFFEQGINPFGGLLELFIKTNRIEGKSGNFKVLEPYAEGQEVKFKSAMERNIVPTEVLLKCPKLLDAESPEQIQYYLSLYKEAIDTNANSIASEEDYKNDE